MGHLDDVLQLTGLLLHLGGQEERGRGDDLEEEEAEEAEAHHQLDSWAPAVDSCSYTGPGSTQCTHISVEPGEGLDHVEAMHVDDGRVDGELGPTGF